MGFGQRMRIGMAAGCKHLAKVKFSYGLGNNGRQCNCGTNTNGLKDPLDHYDSSLL